MKLFTVREAVQATQGRFFGNSASLDALITGAESDSRKIMEGVLFVAYRGTRVDGHDFMADCLRRGAPCCLAEREPRGPEEQPCIVVDSTLYGIAALAGWYRSQFDIPVIGITGSVGKTTAKEMIWSVLRQRLRTHKNRLNLNNEISLPLEILRMSADAEAAVFELGISRFGEMERLASMVRPTVGVVTNIGDAHLEFLGDRAGVLRAKGEMFNYISGEGLAVLNGDDESLRDFLCPVRSISYGRTAGCDFVAEDVENLGSEGMRMTICHHGQRFDAKVSAFGAHMVYAALVGAAVGWALGLNDEELAAGVASYETVGDRARLIHGKNLTILADCYNANPTSAASALESLRALPGRKVCILGDMLELGEASPLLHRKTGSYAARAGARLVVGCGTLAKEICEGAAGEGAQVQWFPDKSSLFAQLPTLLQSGDCVLVKASHSMRFEEIVEELQKLDL